MWVTLFYPMNIIQQDVQVGFVGSEGTLVMPTSLPLTSALWESHGLYLIDDGQVLYLIVARDAVPLLINDVFGVADYRVLHGGKVGALIHRGSPPSSPSMF
jgi:protein transport protein SEC24